MLTDWFLPAALLCVGQTEDEISEMESDIRALDKDLQVKTSSLKLAHTRLENRTCRPGMDLCRDQVEAWWFCSPPSTPPSAAL